MALVRTPYADLNPVFIPGPTNVPDRLRRAMDRQTADHRAPEFGPLLDSVRSDARHVFGTREAEVLLFPATGTAGWEAALVNTLSPGDAVLVARYGVFSDRWIAMCRRHGLRPIVLDRPWGEGAPAELFAEVLAADPNNEIKAVLVTHNETATGVVSDLSAVRRAMDSVAHPALLFVDCVSSLGSMPFEMDEWGVDIAIAGSQKGLMLHAGMAVLAVGPRAFAASDTAGLPRSFLDFAEMRAANAKGGYPYTPPLQLIHGLRASLDMLFEEGLEAVYARHRRHAEGVRRAVQAWDMTLVARARDLESDSVSAIFVPEGADANRLIAHAHAAYGMSFGAGLGALDGQVFRIGHLGALTDAVVLSGLATIEMAMADLDYPITLGSGVAAAQQHFRATNPGVLRAAA